jgi:hypothetical protein
MFMHYFTTIVIKSGTIMTEVLKEEGLHLIWTLPYILFGMGGSIGRLSSRQHSSLDLSTIPNNFILFRVPKDLFLKLFTYVFILTQYGRGMMDSCAAVKYKALRLFCFEEISAAVGDGLLYLQLRGAYLICRTLLCYSSIICGM